MLLATTFPYRVFYRVAILAVVVSCWWAEARTQDAVSFLKAAEVTEVDLPKVDGTAASQTFTFARNLIFFSAELDGRAGNFILDTGAPALLLNNRGAAVAGSASTGLAAGGEVALTNHKVKSFRMGGLDLGRRWAYALDLRSLEKRMQRTVDGFVGYDLLRKGELRIDYPGRIFQLRESSRQPRYGGRAPDVVLYFKLIDHLPVVTLKAGRQKLRFAIDTGAGVNLIDERHRNLFLLRGEKMNIQGLDGANANRELVTIDLKAPSGFSPTDLVFAALPLEHLQETGATPVDGLLGSSFLAKYCVGIDYRRRKLYLWQPARIQ